MYNLYGWSVSQKLRVNNFEWMKNISKCNEDFVKSYNGESDKGYFLEDDVQYPEKLHELYNDLPFLPNRMKIEKVENLVANLHDKTEYVIHTRNLKQALNRELAMKKVHRSIKFNQKAWLKPYFDMNTDLRKKAKIILKKTSKLMNNAVLEKTMKNVRKLRDIKILVTEKRRNYLVSDLNYHTTIFFSKSLLTIEMRKT